MHDTYLKTGVDGEGAFEPAQRDGEVAARQRAHASAGEGAKVRGVERHHSLARLK